MALLCSAQWTFGQSTFGGIVGIVKDHSQSSVTGAQLTLTSLDDGAQRTASSDSNGGFEFINLKAGHYELTVHAEGFTDYKISSYDPGNLNLSYRGSLQRPDCTGNGNVANPGTGSMFNIDAFNPIPTVPVGNCGVGILEGPGTTTIAAGLAKTLHLTERLRLRFEGTFTNLMNHPNFAPPPTNVTSASFGFVQNVQTAENSGNRTGQLSLRLDF